MSPKYILIVGNFIDGFKFIGPFKSSREADDASNEYDDITWIQELKEHNDESS